MKRVAIGIALLLLGGGGYVLSQAPASGYRVPVWTGVRYEWPLLGPSLVIQGGRLDVLLPPAQARTYGVRVQPDAAGRYLLPAGARNVVVYINGLRAGARHPTD